MSKRMSDKPSHIDAPKGHKPPTAISETPPASVPKHRPRTKLQTQASQYAYQQTLPKDERGVVQFPNDSPFHPDYFRSEEPIKKKSIRLIKTATDIKDKAMNAILTRIWAFVRDVILQWAFPFPIFKKGEDGVTPIRDSDGKKVIDWVATLSARALSLVVVIWGTVEVLGQPVSEWAKRIAEALGMS